MTAVQRAPYATGHWKISIVLTCAYTSAADPRLSLTIFRSTLSDSERRRPPCSVSLRWNRVWTFNPWPDSTRSGQWTFLKIYQAQATWKLTRTLHAARVRDYMYMVWSCHMERSTICLSQHKTSAPCLPIFKARLKNGLFSVTSSWLFA